MNRKIIAVAIVAVALTAAVALMRRSGPEQHTHVPTSAARRQPTPDAQAARAEERVPAHYESEPAKGSLSPTLSPDMFKGVTREAYRAVGEMPELIARMPCYCHCDEGFGHKSLQSCFVDDHAAHCDICVREALAAYRLRKGQGLSAAEIRERIVAEYSKL